MANRRGTSVGVALAFWFGAVALPGNWIAGASARPQGAELDAPVPSVAQEDPQNSRALVLSWIESVDLHKTLRLRYGVSSGSYDIRYSNVDPSSDPAWWVDARTVEHSLVFVVEDYTGDPFQRTLPSPVEGLEPNTRYWMAVRIVIRAGELETPIQPAYGDTPDDLVDPGAVNDLRLVSTARDSVTLEWTAPADDGYGSPAYGDRPIERYDLRWSDQAPTPLQTNEEWFRDVASSAAPQPGAREPRSTQTWRVSGLAASTRYSFAIVAFDEIPRRGAVGNILAADTSEGDGGSGSGGGCGGTARPMAGSGLLSGIIALAAGWAAVSIRP